MQWDCRWVFQVIPGIRRHHHHRPRGGFHATTALMKPKVVAIWTCTIIGAGSLGGFTTYDHYRQQHQPPYQEQFYGGGSLGGFGNGFAESSANTRNAPTPVPEPSSLALLAAGISAAGLIRLVRRLTAH